MRASPLFPLLSARKPAKLRPIMLRWVGLLILLILPTTAFPAALGQPPVGPHTGLTPADFTGIPSFTPDDRLVLTPYFYWYDVFTGEHLLNADGSDALTDHPPTLTGFSLRSPSWHRTQLLDMEAAGIDVVLPVYWGEPSQRLPGRPVADQPWSYAGLPPLVEARERLVQEGRNPPRIGLFYDTSTLQFNAAGERIDLTTDRGRQWFYESVRDFFSLVPPRHWAMIGGRPVVVLYAAGFAVAHDQSCIEHLHTEFARDFGGRTPFVIREISWAIHADDTYAWGGALGLRNPGVASLGPGYDHSAVPGREPLVVPRENGAFFERQWIAFLQRPSRRVIIETWNEFHEGTDIAPSREYGRQYVDLNRRYADLFKAGYQPPRPPGSLAGSRHLDLDLGTNQPNPGITLLDSADGLTQASNIAGFPCRTAAPNPHGARYFYFRIDDSFKPAESLDVLVVVDYFDADRGTLRIDYDGSDSAAPYQGAYTPSLPVVMNGTGTWRTSTFRLRAARFLNRQNAGADFRLSVGDLPLAIRRVQVVREGLLASPPPPPGLDGCDLRVHAAPGETYDLEISDDLRTWRQLVRLRPPMAVSRHLDVPAHPAPQSRWYRLRGPLP